jgi:hypothetical protein
VRRFKERENRELWRREKNGAKWKQLKLWFRNDRRGDSFCLTRVGLVVGP